MGFVSRLFLFPWCVEPWNARGNVRRIVLGSWRGEAPFKFSVRLYSTRPKVFVRHNRRRREVPLNFFTARTTLFYSSNTFRLSLGSDWMSYCDFRRLRSFRFLSPSTPSIPRVPLGK